MKRKKKLIVASLIVAAGLVQSACSANIGATETADASTPVETASPQPPSDKSTEEADVTAEEGSREAVIPPLGGFDRRDRNFVQFNPCTEIPEAFLKEVGLLERRNLEHSSDVDGRCAFNIDSSFGEAVVKLQGNDWGFDEYEHLSGEHYWSAISDTAPLKVVRDDLFDGTACSAVIETKRGTFDVTFQSYIFEESDLDSCEEAERWLKLILEKDGKYGSQAS